MTYNRAAIYDVRDYTPTPDDYTDARPLHLMTRLFIASGASFTTSRATTIMLLSYDIADIDLWYADAYFNRGIARLNSANMKMPSRTSDCH